MATSYWENNLNQFNIRILLFVWMCSLVKRFFFFTIRINKWTRWGLIFSSSNKLAVHVLAFSNVDHFKRAVYRLEVVPVLSGSFKHVRFNATSGLVASEALVFFCKQIITGSANKSFPSEWPWMQNCLMRLISPSRRKPVHFPSLSGWISLLMPFLFQQKQKFAAKERFV